LAGSPSEPYTPDEEKVIHSDDDIDPNASAAVRHFLKTSKPHKSAPHPTNPESAKKSPKQHAKRTAGLAENIIKRRMRGVEGLFSRGKFLSNYFQCSGSLPNLNAAKDDDGKSAYVTLIVHRDLVIYFAYHSTNPLLARDWTSNAARKTVTFFDLFYPRPKLFRRKSSTSE
jgi:hypothetical protein